MINVVPPYTAVIQPAVNYSTTPGIGVKMPKSGVTDELTLVSAVPNDINGCGQNNLSISDSNQLQTT